MRRKRDKEQYKKYTKKYYSKFIGNGDKRKYSREELLIILAKRKSDTEIAEEINRTLHAIQVIRTRFKNDTLKAKYIEDYQITEEEINNYGN